MTSLTKTFCALIFILLTVFSCKDPDKGVVPPNNQPTPTCFDNILNQDEVMVDCGGTFCPECPPSCDDLIANQDEESQVENPKVIGIDCGGTVCEPCASCSDGIQNAHWVHDPNLTEADLGQPGIGRNYNGVLYRLIMELGVDCGFPCNNMCLPTNSDGIQNGDEEGVDCGGSAAPPCPPATCMDGIHNGNETGIDCGDADGLCPECPYPTCNDGIQNIHIEYNLNLPAGYVVVIETGIDCDNNPTTLCPDCPIPTCFDGIRNGSETGVDCGGMCYTVCGEANCNNGVMDGNETGIDCDNDPSTPCPICPTCSDGIKNGAENGIDCTDYPIPGLEECAICPP